MDQLPSYNRALALQAGARLGPYEITSPLGAGGMGEVYRARDTRLARDVAIKVLAPGFASDLNRLARFEQEAKAAAALNHPNILAVFDVSIGGELPYVVAELLEGQTLRAALSDGALPRRTAADVATQLARGMAAAHQKGIVHRDLKPENIFLTADGHAKILDFGLAKLLEAPADAAGLSQLTTAAPATMPGVVLGTIGYMSPEQVRGQPADHRTDIFAFGAVFYEMLSGCRAFSRASGVETMTAILKDDPPELAGEIQAFAPALDRIVRRCLEKNPEQRFQSASDIAFAIEAVSGTTLPLDVAPAAAVLANTAASTVANTPRWRRVLTLAAAVAAGGAIGLVTAQRLATTPSEIVTFQAKTFDGLPVTNARFMPDGQTIVYSAARRGYAPDLFVINASAEAPQLLGVANAQLLAVSSTGELAVLANAKHLAQRVYSGTLSRMTMGSSPRPLLDNVREADWSPDGGALAIIHDIGSGRDRLEYPAGTVLHEASGYLSDLRVSPDGDRVAFFEHQVRFDDRGWVKVVDRAGQVTTLAGEFWGLEGLAWTPDGARVVFSGNATGGSVMQPMSVLATGRAPAQPVFGVPGRFIVFDVARDGRWLAAREDLSLGVRARTPSQAAERDLSWLGAAGARDMSADGQWLLLVDAGLSGGRNYGVVLRKTDGSQTIRLGDGDAQRLSPDGRWAAAIIASPPQLVVYPVGTGETIRIPRGTIERYESAAWFPDGRRLLTCGSEAGRAPRCYEQDLAGSPPRPLTEEGVRASLAPDGRTLLLKMPNGGFQVASTDGATARSISALHADDTHVAWSRDSRFVFVRRGTDVPAVMERVDLMTAQRTVVGQIAPEGLGRVASLSVADWVEDGPWYAYNLTSLSASLFMVSGALPSQ